MDNSTEFIGRLSVRLSSMDLQCTEAQLIQCSRHFDLLKRFSAVHNLTSNLDIQSAVDLHYADCIKGLSLVGARQELMDIGSGAGFPGFIAAILWPQTQVTLVESVRKKCSFLQMAASQCELSNVKIINRNFFSIQAGQHLVSRAAFPPGQLSQIVDTMVSGGELCCFLSARQIDDLELQLKHSSFATTELLKYSVGEASMAVAIIRV